MKASEVLEVLRISRITLIREKGLIKAVRKPNGHYEYDEKSVYEYLLKSTGKQIERKTVIYARVSTGAKIIVINDYTNEKSETEELMEEIFTLLHSFPMKFYSKRRTIKKCIENAIS